MNFYTIVIAVAIIIFTAIMIWFAYTINVTTTKEIFPPVSNPCPDLWTYDASGSIANCKKTGVTGSVSNVPATNVANVADKYTTSVDGSNTSYTIYPDSSLWNSKGGSTICGKKTWAVQNNIQWSGVSNYNGCT